MPKVSVIIPAYNAAMYISEAMESVLHQTYQDWELIVVDDGSNDGTKDIVGIFLARYPQKSKYLYQKNAGTSAARNRGVKASQGDFIAFLDADDVWFPQKLELQMAHLQSHPETDLLYSNATMISCDQTRSWPYVKKNEMLFAPEEVYFRLLARNFIPFTSIVVRKSVFESGEYFNEALMTSEDTDWLLRLAKKYNFQRLDSVLLTYRMSRGSKNNHRENRNRAIIRNIRIYFKTEEVPQKFRPAIKRRLANAHYELGYALYETGRFKEAHGNFLQSLSIWPFLNFKQLIFTVALSLPEKLIKNTQTAKRQLLKV